MLQAGDLLLYPLYVYRRDGRAQPDLGRGLVQQVYGLVRQEAVGYVAVRELAGGGYSLVGDPHAVMGLVAVPEAEQYLHGLVHGRLIHQDRLEAPLQRRVLLDVLAVLVEGRSPDYLKLPPRERGLEHVRGVHRALGPASADDLVQLVDKQDDVVLLILELLEHLLHPLLEVAPEPGTGHEPADIERQAHACP